MDIHIDGDDGLEPEALSRWISSTITRGDLLQLLIDAIPCSAARNEVFWHSSQALVFALRSSPTVINASARSRTRSTSINRKETAASRISGQSGSGTATKGRASRDQSRPLHTLQPIESPATGQGAGRGIEPPLQSERHSCSRRICAVWLRRCGNRSTHCVNCSLMLFLLSQPDL